MEPTKDQILEQLETIVSSEAFASSPRMRRFLRYIVEKTLDGQAASLKGYAIGVDVFDRGDNFDPQMDTIVRVQARNLRKAIHLYNLSHGKTDRVKIELHKGGYVPTFSFNDPASVSIPKTEDNTQNETAPSKAGPHLKSKKRFFVPVVFTVFFSALTLLVIFGVVGNSKSHNGFDHAMMLPMGPSVSIAPFEVIGSASASGTDSEMKNLQAGLHIELVDKISRFKDLFVVTAYPKDTTAKNPGTMTQTQFELGGTIQRSGDDIKVMSVLKRQSNGHILWTRSHRGTLNSPVDLLKMQTKIAIDVAASLGQPHNGINSRFSAEQSHLEGMHTDHFKCLLQFYEYQHAKSEQLHFKTRKCLEKSTQEMPNFSSGWAALSWMYADEGFNDYNRRQDTAPPTQRALEAALKAVEADPGNAMAHQYLAMAKFTIGDDTGFLQAANTALNLNPNDPEILAIVGNYLWRMGNEEAAIPMIEKALALNHASPPFYHASLTLHYYLRNEMDAALHHGQIYLQGESFSARILYVALLARAGRIDEAKKSYIELVKRNPYFPGQYESIIKSRRIPDGLYENVIEDLITAGLVPVP